MKIENSEVHFEYLFEIVKNGEVVDSWKETNLVPTQGLNHILDVVLKQGTPIPAWYVGVYEGDYTPVAGDTAATFPGLATEISAYAETTRPLVSFSAPSAGASSNSASRAEFSFNAIKTVRGGFVSSVNGKGSTSGLLLSAVKLTTPKAMDAESILLVTVGITLTSS